MRSFSSSWFVTDGAPQAPRSPDNFPSSAPGQLWHSAALQLCQAEKGTPVFVTCQVPCWGPSVCSAAEFQFHPHCCPLPVLSCGCQHLQPVISCCCGSPCSSSRVAGPLQEPGRISQHTAQGDSQAWQMPQAAWPLLPQTLPSLLTL